MSQILDPNKFLLSFFIFFLTNILAWIQTSAHRIWDISEKNQIILAIVLGMPISLGYYFAWKFGSESLSSWWSCRLLGFGISFLVFPILTHYILNESMFKPKIIISIALSVVIVFIQIYWPDNK